MNIAHKNGLPVFSTNKTLNERFTSREPRCAFTINNGYTRPYENNTLKERIVIASQVRMKNHERFSSYLQGDVKETEIPLGFKQKSSQLISKRRNVLAPKDFPKMKEFTKVSKDVMENLRIKQTSKYLSYPISNINRSRKYFKNNYTKFAICSQFSQKKNQYYSRALHKWRRSPPTNELDKQRDTFMDEVRFKSSRKYSRNYEDAAFHPSILRRNSQFCNQFFRKWKKRPTPTKEDLDRELDIYMDEVRYRSRIFKGLMPVKLENSSHKENKISTVLLTEDQNFDIDVHITNNREYSPKRKHCTTGSKSMTEHSSNNPSKYLPHPTANINSSRKYLRNYENGAFHPSILRKNSQFCNQFYRRWKRPTPTKEQLDRELDIYMDEVRYRSQILNGLMPLNLTNSSHKENEISTFLLTEDQSFDVHTTNNREEYSEYLSYYEESALHTSILRKDRQCCSKILYKRERPTPTKEELDRELDIYMAEVLYKCEIC